MSGSRTGAAHSNGDAGPVAPILARFIAELTFEDIPAQVVEATKALVVDQLACQLIGSTMPWVRPAMMLVELGHGTKRESTVVNSQQKYLAADAAFLNATYGQACELDDSTFGSAGHIGTATIPVALAVGERERICGADLIVAIVAGYETMYRMMASVRPHHNTRGFHSQSIGGPFAGAAAAGKILGLDAEQMTNALAIAGSHACGPLEYDQSGGEVKRVHAGIAARAGVHSALLAGFGLTGPETIIEGKRGFCRLFSTQHDLSNITRDLGMAFNITNAWFKVYPATGPVHTAIEATARLVAQHDIRSQDVTRIVAEIAETSLMHGGGIHQPRDVLGAQFSLAYSVALRLLKRSNLLSDYTDPALWSDPEMLDLMNKVEMHADPQARGKLHHMAKITIELNDGRSVAATVEYPPGTPPNPATEAQLLEKACDLSSAALSSKRIDRMIALVRDLEKVADVSDLAALMSADPECTR